MHEGWEHRTDSRTIRPRGTRLKGLATTALKYTGLDTSVVIYAVFLEERLTCEF
jgi:hypothetical protein